MIFNNQRIITTYLTIMLVTLFVGSYMILGAEIFNGTVVFNEMLYAGIITITFISSALCLCDYVSKRTTYSRYLNMFLFVSMMTACALQIFEVSHSIVTNTLGHGLVVDVLVFAICLSEGLRVLDHAQILFIKAEIDRLGKNAR